MFVWAVSAQPTPPEYQGEVCVSGSTVTVSVTADPQATAILIYPTPPGGGYYMTDDGSGTYTASFSGVSAGSPFSFRLVVQAPNQFEYPPHSFTLEPGCVSFATDGDDGGGDPGGNGGDPGIDPGDFGQGGLPHSRSFRHDVRLDGDQWSVLLEVGQPASPLPAVTGVDLRYRVNGGPVQTGSLADLGTFIWGVSIPDAAEGDTIEYGFVTTVGIEPVDTAWFTRTLGEAAQPLPSEPIETVAALRFRDRHENEWRFDHYPQGYDVGRTFDLAITDHGHELDILLMTAPEVPVNAV
ncbi:MAG: hypothetical protein AAFY46_12030, partial [Planctomycetota bacterium]